MAMSSNVCGFRKPDEKYNKMKAVYDTCVFANIDVPDEVNDFFGWVEPNGIGIEVDLDEFVIEDSIDTIESWTIAVDDIPNNVTHIRFSNSY